MEVCFMGLIRWRPMRDLVDIQDEINRMFEDIARPSDGEARPARMLPPADVIENKDTFIVRTELPGLRKEDVKVTLQNNVLTVSGEKMKEQEEKNQTYYRVERSYGAFSRTFELPMPVDANNIKADFKDGILTIELPKVEEAKPKEILISVK
jgi:HSP20 family protein